MKHSVYGLLCIIFITISACENKISIPEEPQKKLVLEFTEMWELGSEVSRRVKILDGNGGYQVIPPQYLELVLYYNSYPYKEITTEEYSENLMKVYIENDDTIVLKSTYNGNAVHVNFRGKFKIIDKLGMEETLELLPTLYI